MHSAVVPILFFVLQPTWVYCSFIKFFVQHSQGDLLPLTTLCGEGPGRDSNPGRADLVAGTLNHLTTTPPLSLGTYFG